MSRKRTNRGRAGASEGPAARGRAPGAKSAVLRRPRFDAGVLVGAASLAVVIAGSALIFDTAADASFDAPKRLVFLIGTAVAALAAFGFASWRRPFSLVWPIEAGDVRLPPLLAAAALLLTAASALVSPHRTVALDTLRVIGVGAFLLPLGASRIFARGRSLLTATFLAASAVNAAVSVLQARRIYQPFPLVTSGDREATGAFAGNVGYLALSLALAAVVSLGLVLTARRIAIRVAAGILTLLFAAALLVNQNITSLSALGVGTAVLLFALFGRRAAVPLAGALLLLAAAVAAYAPMRTRTAGAIAAARAGEWDRLLSYRSAPWAAAAGMARDRPLLGYGPGTFEAEFVAHRLAADVRLRRRLVNPLATSTYAEAHCDYLQPFAEEGVVAGVTIVAAAALLLVGLARRRGTFPAADEVERILLVAFLAAGATAALTWFPFQRPITAAPLLLAAGRGWRLWRDGGPGGEPA